MKKELANKCQLCGNISKNGEDALFHFAEAHPKEAREGWTRANMEESQMDYDMGG